MRFFGTCAAAAMVVSAIHCGDDDRPNPGLGADSTTGRAGSAGNGNAGSGGMGNAGSTSAGGRAGSAGAGGGAETATGGAAGTGGGAGTGGAAGASDGGRDGSSDAGARDGAEAGPSDARSDVGGDATGGDAAPYNPCPPAGTACAIMPLGDSITQGVPNPAAGGYRVPLFRLARTNNQSITFVGSGSDGPAMVDGVTFPAKHEGHSGYNIDTTQGRQGISQFFPAAITTYKPHIVLLMIGTNDVDTNESMIPTRLGMLMDTILGADPKLVLVVAQIVPAQKAAPDAAPNTYDINARAYNAAIPALVKARADAGKHVLMVDMYDAFTSNPNYSTELLADRLHPTPAGFTVMANTWYPAIRSFLR